MPKAILGVLMVLFAVTPTAQTPQVPAPTQALYMTAAELQAMIKAYPGQNAGIKSIDASKHVVDFWLEQRKPGAGAATTGLVHTEITEIYYIVQGTATLVTGGKLIESKPAAVSVPAWPGASVAFNTPTLGGKFEGSVARKVGPGDVVVVPPGAVHQWSSVDPPGLIYFIARIDPAKKLTAGYVNPALKNNPALKK